MKYLLTTGETTNKIEYYIIDLFKLYLTVYPKDIPGLPKLGFNFLISNIQKSDIVNEVSSRLKELVSVLRNKVPDNINISVKSAELVDEKTIKLVIMVDEIESDDIFIDINKGL